MKSAEDFSVRSTLSFQTSVPACPRRFHTWITSSCWRVAGLRLWMGGCGCAGRMDSHALAEWIALSGAGRGRACYHYRKRSAAFYSFGMEITAEQFACIEPLLPRQRGNVSHESIAVINAILYMAESGCTWRNLPKRFGNWHTIYTRISRWAKTGVLDMVFEKLQKEQLIRIRIEASGLSAGIVRLDALATAATQITQRTALENSLEDGPPKLIWLPRVLGTR